MCESIRPDGQECSCFGDQYFRQLRQRDGVPDEFVNGHLSFRPGGGKGGDLMAYVDDTYIVKELSPSDNAALMEVTESYLQHVTTGHTLLTPIYLHYRVLATGRCFFVMRNMIGNGPFDTVYDLKGCADDKMLIKGGEAVPTRRKRIWQIWMWFGECAWSQDRHKYYDGKLRARKAQIQLIDRQRSQVVTALRRDSEWLASRHLMDYSCLIAIRERQPEAKQQGPTGRQPLLRRKVDGSEVAVYIAIIDFLQKWNAKKEVAKAIKCMEPDKATVPPEAYARRFCRCMEERFVPVHFEPEALEKKRNPSDHDQLRLSRVVMVIALLQFITAAMMVWTVP
mmetsp:Transcript_13059/g.24020  ORF Transcript_13059/g.24020 Transcript_13059/m.24020 type:complete len:338 (-) Transcript_13059:123-1136(-)